MLHLLQLYYITLSWDKFAVHHFVPAAHSIFDNFARDQRAHCPIITCSASRRGCSAFAFSSHFNTDHGLILSSLVSLSAFEQHFLFLAILVHIDQLVEIGEQGHCAHKKCSKWRKKYLKEWEIEKGGTKFCYTVLHFECTTSQDNRNCIFDKEQHWQWNACMRASY